MRAPTSLQTDGPLLRVLMGWAERESSLVSLLLRTLVPSPHLNPSTPEALSPNASTRWFQAPPCGLGVGALPSGS